MNDKYRRDYLKTLYLAAGKSILAYITMPHLISKLQHNTYEKGEFSDEQPRDLAETIQIIKNFPWDAERPKTDIQLTGPSVTIQDEEINYLKLGLYFGGKFCVYYLDKDNHLYEYHAPDIDTASKLVNDFFDHNMDLSVFEKHFFNIGNQPHFVTQQFIYRVNPLRVWAFAILFSIYFSLGISYLIVHSIDIKGGYALLFILFVILIGALIGYGALIVINGRQQYLKISRGNNVFSYGPDEQHITVYNKADVAELVHLTAKGDRNINNIEIRFKNGQIIKPKMLISDFDLIHKFPENLGVKVTYIRKSIFGESKYN